MKAERHKPNWYFSPKAQPSLKFRCLFTVEKKEPLSRDGSPTEISACLWCQRGSVIGHTLRQPKSSIREPWEIPTPWHRVARCHRLQWEQLNLPPGRCLLQHHKSSFFRGATTPKTARIFGSVEKKNGAGVFLSFCVLSLNHS